MTRVALLSLAATALACSAQGPSGPKGQVRINTQATTHLATTDGSGPQVCGTFSLQPYSLDANGNQTLAGNPLTLTSVAAAQTDTIAGCIAGPADAAGDNWGYLVTATNFVDCANPTAGAIAGLSPSVVTGNFPVLCAAGVDTPLQIAVDVSISADNSAGYVDISVGVNSTEVQIGCKTADFDGTTLHFGSSWMGDLSATAPDGVWGLTTSASTTQQWSGQVTSGMLDQYYTGQMSLPAPGIANIVQTFVPASCANNTYVATEQPQCITSASTSASGTPTATTVAQLADAFIADTDDGWASASIQSDGSDLLINSALTFSPIPASANPAANTPAIADPSNPPQIFNDPSIAQFTGLWPSQGGFGFVFTFAGPGGNLGFGLLNYDPGSSAWLLGGEYSLDGASSDLQACLGLYASGSSCIKPNDCSSLLNPKGEGVVIPRTLHASLEIKSLVAVKNTDFTGSLSGSLVMPDTSGTLIATPLKFDTATLDSPATIDCTAAVATGVTKGYVQIGVDSFAAVAGSSAAKLGLALASALPAVTVPYDCANPTDVAPSLPIVLAGLDSEKNEVTLSAERDLSVIDQRISPTTCMAGSDDATAIVSTNSSSYLLSNSKFPSDASCAFRFRQCSNDSDGSDADCGALTVSDSTSYDMTSQRTMLTTTVEAYQQQQQQQQARTMRTESFAASRQDAFTASSVRYGAPYVSDVRDSADLDCSAAAPAAQIAPAFVSGVGPAGNAFAYRVGPDVDGSPMVAIAANATLDCGENPSAPAINSYKKHSLAISGAVLDTCISGDAPDTLYVTSRLQSHEPGDPTRIGVSKVTLDLSDVIAPLVDESGSPDILAAASACMQERQGTAPSEARMSIPNPAIAGLQQITPLPGAPVGEVWACAASDGGFCYCIGSAGGLALGHMSGWLFSSSCKIDYVF